MLGLRASHCATSLVELDRSSMRLIALCAGSLARSNLAASSLDLECQRLTLNCIGRCGTGVGSHSTRSCTSRPSTRHRMELAHHSISYR